MTPPALIFDLDGTLVDSAPDLAAALNRTLADEGHPPVSVAEIRPVVDSGSRAIIERGLKQYGRQVATNEVARLLPVFLAHYRDNLCRETRLFSDVDTVLPALAKRHAMGICTNKPETLAVALIEALGLTSYFPVILGGDSLAHKKPDARHFNAVRALLDASAPTIMIGDSPTDIATARAAEVPVIGVSFGYSTVPADQLEADIVIDRFADLPDAIARIIAAPGFLDSG